MKKFLNNLTYSLIANVVNLIVSSGTSLLIPFILGNNIDQYGYYQIYLFYIAYIGFFHFGLCDGILLKDGGKDYESLNKNDYSCQFYFLTISELIISFLIAIIATFLSTNADYVFIAIAFGVNLIVFLPRNFLSYILQSTSRLKENALITIIGRTIFFILVLVLLIIKNTDYRWFVASDLFGKIIALVYACLKCKDIVLSKPTKLRFEINEIMENISVGIKLMLASVSSMVSTGIIRVAIQHYWDIEVYGKISLTLTVTNLVLTFISAMAVVLYPTLRRMNVKSALMLYEPINDILMVLLFLSLFFCYPLQKILLLFLPQYADSLFYLPILFPVCVYSAKVTLLIQTYMQVFRLESKILHINIFSIFITLFLTLISVVIMKNITFAIFSILISQAIRCVCAETILSKTIKIKILKNCILENVVVFFYVIVSFKIGMLNGMIGFVPIFLLYIFIKKVDYYNDVDILRRNNLINNKCI